MEKEFSLIDEGSVSDDGSFQNENDTEEEGLVENEGSSKKATPKRKLSFSIPNVTLLRLQDF